jgi:hypothetical protein
MDIYAAFSLRYMERLGAANDFADVSVKNHLHGSLHPLAQYRNEVTRDEVLASRAIVNPLTLMMCAPLRVTRGVNRDDHNQRSCLCWSSPWSILKVGRTITLCQTLSARLK